MNFDLSQWFKSFESIHQKRFVQIYSLAHSVTVSAGYASTVSDGKITESFTKLIG